MPSDLMPSGLSVADAAELDAVDFRPVLAAAAERLAVLCDASGFQSSARALRTVPANARWFHHYRRAASDLRTVAAAVLVDAGRGNLPDCAATVGPVLSASGHFYAVADMVAARAWGETDDWQPEVAAALLAAAMSRG